MHCSLVGWRLGKFLFGFPSGIVVGGSGSSESGLRGGMGLLIDDEKFFIIFIAIICVLFLVTLA